jgi:hypothetical protein
VNDTSDGLARPFLNRPLPNAPSKSNSALRPAEPELPAVRAYMMTGGRTSTGDTKLEFETMVSLTNIGRERLPQLLFEQGKIGRVIAEGALSVAEVAAKVRVPIGVAQVLCADMLRADLLEQHTTTKNLSDDISLLTRLINGVRSL